MIKLKNIEDKNYQEWINLNIDELVDEYINGYIDEFESYCKSIYEGELQQNG